MKKAGYIIVLMILCCSLCACDPGSHSVDRDALKDVVSVELIQYENTEQKHFASWVPDQFDELLPFNNSNAIVLETLSEDKISGFLDTFSQADILNTYYAYNSPKDICIRLSYANGNFLIAWANYADESHSGYIGEYSSDGAVVSFWGSFSSLDDYEDLVEQHFARSLE